MLFFLMLFVLGIGSAVALTSAMTTILCDQFKGLVFWKTALGISIVGFLAGLIYVTPTGQWFLNLVDHFGGTLLVFVLGTLQVMGVFWIYGKTLHGIWSVNIV